MGVLRSVFPDYVMWLWFKQNVFPTNIISLQHIWTINKPKQEIFMENLFSFDERFGLLYEDMEVRNAIFARNKIMQNMCTTLNSRVWGIDYITSQPTLAKFGK